MATGGPRAEARPLGHLWPCIFTRSSLYSQNIEAYILNVCFLPNKTPLDGQGWLWDGRVADGAAGGAGGELGGGADSQVCRLFSYRSERNHSFRSAS